MRDLIIVDLTEKKNRRSFDDLKEAMDWANKYVSGSIVITKEIAFLRLYDLPVNETEDIGRSYVYNVYFDKEVQL